MSKFSEEEILRDTLEKAEVNLDISKLKQQLSYGYSDKERKKVHSETNNLIQNSLNTDSLGKCIHVTGEMRALTDPFHRYLCEQINQKDEEVFKVIYNLPEEYRKETTKILEWNLNNWTTTKSNREWHDELRTIYSVANRSVNLYAMDTIDEVQYSVFGNKYVLLQEKHPDKATVKHTWLLESEELNHQLEKRAEKLISKSKDVDEGNYRRFTQNLNSIVARRYLIMLQKDSYTYEELFKDEMANDFTESPKEIIDSLKIMNFIHLIKNQKVQITKDGREFIR